MCDVTITVTDLLRRKATNSKGKQTVEQETVNAVSVTTSNIYEPTAQDYIDESKRWMKKASDKKEVRLVNIRLNKAQIYATLAVAKAQLEANEKKPSVAYELH